MPRRYLPFASAAAILSLYSFAKGSHTSSNTRFSLSASVSADSTISIARRYKKLFQLQFSRHPLYPPYSVTGTNMIGHGHLLSSPSSVNAIKAPYKWLCR